MPITSKNAAFDPDTAENSTNATNILPLFESDVERGLKLTAFVLLFAVSLPGNSLLIAVLFKNANQRMRTPNNHFIFNMACADILLTVYCLPQTAIIIASQYRWLISGVAGQIFCRLSFFIGQMSVLVSTGSLFVIALDRCFMVFYPLKRKITLRVARCVIALLWIFAIIFTLPLSRMANVFEIHPGFLVCSIDLDMLYFAIAYLLFCFPIIIGLPLTATICIYIAIGIKLNRTKSPGNQLPSTQERRERMNHKILTMLVAVVMALIICRFPLIILIIACFSGSAFICASPTYMFVGWFLTYANSGINPWIYFIFNEQFRHGARLLLEKRFPCCFKTTNEVDPVDSDGIQMTTHVAQHH